MMTSLSTKLITGDGRPITVEELANYYRDVVNYSVPTQGKIQKLGEDVYSLTNKFNTVDCDNLESIKTQKVYSLTTKSIGNGNNEDNKGKCIDVVRCVSDHLEVAELISVTSENGRFTARLRSPTKQQDKQILEIWDRSRLLKTFDTSELDAHGSINTDPIFSNIVWSHFGNQDKLSYVCQRKRPKNLSYFKDSKPSKEEDTTNRGEEHNKREDWGEALVNIDHTIIGILDIAKNYRITTIDIADHSLGIPQWLHHLSDKIVCQAYSENPRRLGLLHCNSRPCKILIFDLLSDLKNPETELKGPTESYHTVRVSNAADKLVFLSNPTFGPHKHSVKLSLYNIATRQQISLPVDLSGNDLFMDDLPRNCFSSDDEHILFASTDHVNHHMYLYTLENNKVTEIKFPCNGLSLLDFRYNIILVSGADIDATPTLFVATVNLSNTNDVVAWHQIEDCIHMEEIEYETYKIPTQDKSSFISAILTKPNLEPLQFDHSKDRVITNYEKLPTVVLVHGGPHSASLTSFQPPLVFYARLGLRVMLINYRGSTGVTEEYVKSLCGKIGNQDVADCLEAIRYFAQNKLIDTSKLVVQGGSHGGFLSCHLSCQDEYKFTSAIIRNPVVDLTSMYGTTDLPDWVETEAFGQSSSDPTWLPDEKNMVVLRNKSPMYLAHKANVPTLMLLGNKDKRVPMFQGERWADKLKARGVDVHCKIYPDGHSLSMPESAADSTITAAIWILDHLPNFVR